MSSTPAEFEGPTGLERKASKSAPLSESHATRAPAAFFFLRLPLFPKYITDPCSGTSAIMSSKVPQGDIQADRQARKQADYQARKQAGRESLDILHEISKMLVTFIGFDRKRAIANINGRILLLIRTH